MPKCDYCEKEITLPYTCGYCGGSFCSEHRLPENHDCKGLDKLTEQSKQKGRLYRGISEELKTGPKKEPPEKPERMPFDLRRESGEEPFSVSTWSIFKKFFLGNVTFILLLIMIIAFIGQIALLGLLGPESYGSVMSWLTPTRNTVLTRPWTLLTSIFLHSTSYTFHLFFNGLVLMFIGPALERRVGGKDFIQLFLAAGIVASLAQLMVSAPDIPLLGASGAIFGILGALTVMSPRMPILLFFFIPMQLWMLTLGYGVIEAFLAISRAGGMIAHMAHFSGLVAGLVYGYKLRKDREKKTEEFFKAVMGG